MLAESAVAAGVAGVAAVLIVLVIGLCSCLGSSKSSSAPRGVEYKATSDSVTIENGTHATQQTLRPEESVVPIEEGPPRPDNHAPHTNGDAPKEPVYAEPGEAREEGRKRSLIASLRGSLSRSSRHSAAPSGPEPPPARKPLPRRPPSLPDARQSTTAPEPPAEPSGEGDETYAAIAYERVEREGSRVDRQSARVSGQASEPTYEAPPVPTRSYSPTQEGAVGGAPEVTGAPAAAPPQNIATDPASRPYTKVTSREPLSKVKARQSADQARDGAAHVTSGPMREEGKVEEEEDGDYTEVQGNSADSTTIPRIPKNVTKGGPYSEIPSGSAEGATANYSAVRKSSPPQDMYSQVNRPDGATEAARPTSGSSDYEAMAASNYSNPPVPDKRFSKNKKQDKTKQQELVYQQIDEATAEVAKRDTAEVEDNYETINRYSEARGEGDQRGRENFAPYSETRKPDGKGEGARGVVAEPENDYELAEPGYSGVRNPTASFGGARPKIPNTENKKGSTKRKGKAGALKKSSSKGKAKSASTSEAPDPGYSGIDRELLNGNSRARPTSSFHPIRESAEPGYQTVEEIAEAAADVADGSTRDDQPRGIKKGRGGSFVLKISSV